MKEAEAFLRERGLLSDNAGQPQGATDYFSDNPFDDGEEAATLERALRQQIEAKAVALLAIREHGAKELRQKLLQKFVRFAQNADVAELEKNAEKNSTGRVAELVDEVLAYCKEQNWQSDERYIEQAVSSMMDKGQGPMKIRQKLQQACSDSGAIEAGLDIGHADWLEVMREALIKKYGDVHKPANRNEQAKRMRFLQSRGFPAEWIWKVFR